MKKTYTLLFVLLWIMGSSTVLAQEYLEYIPKRYRTKAYQRFYLGYGFPITNFQETQFASTFNEFTGTTTTEKYVYNIGNSSVAYSAHGGVDIPMVGLGSSTALMLSLGLLAEAHFQLSDINNTTTTNPTIGQKNINDFGGLSYGVPITIDFLSGPDAILDKSRKMSYGLGVGCMPAFHFYVAEDFGLIKGKVHPIVKAEIGSMMGVLFKIRVTYVMGNVGFAEPDKDLLALNPEWYYEGVSFMKKSTLNVGLSVYPMSWLWKKSEWWR